MKLWLATLVGTIGVLTFIQLVHLKAHKDMEMDVHAHCLKNKEGLKRILQKNDY